MKARSGNLNLSKTVPTKVSDMKQGEMLVTADGVYGRVGNQILYQSLADYFYTWNDKTAGGAVSYWGVYDGNTTWSTDHWVCSGSVDVDIRTFSFARFRPVAVRMTHTGGLAAFRLRDIGGNIIASSNSYVSGTELEITYANYSDESTVRSLEWDLFTDSAGSGDITKIEFKDPFLEFFYDPFTSLSDRWHDRPSSGGSITATGGVMSFNLDADSDYSFVGPIWNRGEEIDVWTELTIPAVDNCQLICTFVGGFGPNYYNTTYIEFIRDTGEYNFIIDPDDPGAGSDYTELLNIGQSNIFVRVRYKPTDGDTKMRFFYSYSDPTVGGWTEVPFVNTSPIFSQVYLDNGGNDIGPGHYWMIEFEAVNGDASNPQIITLAAFKEWTE